MILFKLIVYCVMAYSLCNMFVFAMGPYDIFEKIRNFSEKHIPMLYNILNCMICCPTWCGFILSALNFILFPTLLFTPFSIIFGGFQYWYLIIFADGIFTSGIVWLIHSIQNYFEKKAER